MSGDKRFICVKGNESFSQKVSEEDFRSAIEKKLTTLHMATFESTQDYDTSRLLMKVDVIMDEKDRKNSVEEINQAIRKCIETEADRILKPTRDMVVKMLEEKHPFLKRET